MFIQNSLQGEVGESEGYYVYLGKDGKSGITEDYSSKYSAILIAYI